MPPELETTKLLSWQRWPLRENGPAGWLKAGLVAVLAASLWLVLLLSMPPFAAFLLGAIFIVVLLPYYFPATFQIGPDGVLIRRGFFPARLKPWSTFSQVKSAEKGYWLLPSTLPPARQLEPLRALFLPYPLDPELKSAIAAELSYYIPLNTHHGDAENTEETQRNL